MNPTANHPNALLLQEMYAAWIKGDHKAFLSSCAENVTFQVPGKSRLAGKYTRADFTSGLMARLLELSGGTFKIDAHDIMASDRHGIALVTETLHRDGKQVELRSVHVWRIENGKPVAWYEYPRDLYQFDALWG